MFKQNMPGKQKRRSNGKSKRACKKGAHATNTKDTRVIAQEAFKILSTKNLLNGKNIFEKQGNYFRWSSARERSSNTCPMK